MLLALLAGAFATDAAPAQEVGLRLDQRQSISIYFEHVSNAFLAASNEGLDAIGVRYGYRF